MMIIGYSQQYEMEPILNIPSREEIIYPVADS